MSVQKANSSKVVKVAKTAAVYIGIGVAGFAVGALIGTVIQKTLNK